ncbi:hypothetical protein ACLEEB_14350 [Lonsdalea quercina]|uniref:hypothetical protein n=1 Tax=Lonsdalea quercina TaxID=71657 RepID=UPI0039760EEE
MIKKITCILAVIILLTGCEGPKHLQWRTADSDSKKFEYLLSVSSDKSINPPIGKGPSFTETRMQYLQLIGEERESGLFVHQLLSNCFTKDADHWGAASCTTNFYQNALVDEHRKRKDKEKKEMEENEEKCQLSPQCVKDREVDSAARDLNYVYSVVLSQHPYSQAEMDGAIRHLCRMAGEAQRNWLPLNQVKKNLDLVEGIAPNDRIMIKRVASSCWVLSKNGISDGTTKIIIGD